MTIAMLLVNTLARGARKVRLAVPQEASRPH